LAEFNSTACCCAAAAAAAAALDATNMGLIVGFGRYGIVLPFGGACVYSNVLFIFIFVYVVNNLCFEVRIICINK
jgi:hypothetical protein